MARHVCVGTWIAVLVCSVSASAQSRVTRLVSSEEAVMYGRAGVTMGRASASPVETLLQKRVESIDWDEITFEEVLEWLRDEGEEKVNVIPRWTALNLEDVDADKLVTLKLGSTTVAEILTETLDQLSETGEVTFRGQDNTLRISTKTDLNRKLELRVYDVTDILFLLPDFAESAPQIDLSQQTGGGRGGGGGSSQPVFRNAGGQSQEELSQRGEQDPQKMLDDLATLIQETIAPDTWADFGPGVIKGFNKRALVVVNTVEVHEMIAGFFALNR